MKELILTKVCSGVVVGESNCLGRPGGGRDRTSDDSDFLRDRPG